MANEMPSSENYRGLSRKVLQYCESFQRIAAKLRAKQPADAEWAAIEELVDTANYRREGVFLTQTVELTDWAKYKQLIGAYGGNTSWEGTLRRITEVPGLVFLELQERNSREGVTDVSNTVTIYKFNDAEKISKLDVYVAHVEKR